MDASLLQWLKQNKGRQFASPRGIIFGRKPQDIILEDIREDIQEIHISFSKRKTLALPLHFWMFDRALDYLRFYREKAFPIGAAIRPPYMKDSIEGEIWREPRPHKTPYRVAPFILDILVLSGFAEYRYVKNLDTDRKVQGVQIGLGAPRLDPPGAPPLPPPSPVPPKTDFLDKYKNTIEEWTEQHKEQIIESRLNYTWQHKSRFDCEQTRNQVSREIIESRIRNGGALDLETLDKVMKWGFNRKYPDRDPSKALEVTKKAFDYLDNGDLKQATLTLLGVKNVGISRVSKIIGLYDQENLCIYDSRVGHALRTMRHEDKRIVLISPSPVRGGDTLVSYEMWAEQYEQMIWVAEVMRDYLNRKGCTYRLADVEMALFMVGK